MLYTSDVAITLVSNLANPGVYVFSANGMYDPDLTGTGHQPRGFDQLMLFYDHYVVTRARAKCRFFNASTSVPAEVFVTVRDNATPSTSYLDYLESSITKTVQLGVESASTATKTLEFDVDVGKFLGRRDPLSDPQLKGSTSSNPDEGCAFHIGAFTPDVFTASSVLLLVTIEYTCTLIEPKIVAAS
jgi:hypothetical protein